MVCYKLNKINDLIQLKWLLITTNKTEKINLPWAKVCIRRSGGTAPGIPASASAGDECSYVSPCQTVGKEPLVTSGKIK